MVILGKRTTAICKLAPKAPSFTKTLHLARSQDRWDCWLQALLSDFFDDSATA
jgi:hypothetical protein